MFDFWQHLLLTLSPATRIGEIQEGTDPQDWYWVESENNIADWITRGKRPNDIDADSDWQRGPRFLRLPESEWPISKVICKTRISRPA